MRLITCICNDCSTSFEINMVNGKRPRPICGDCRDKELAAKRKLELNERTETLAKLNDLPVDERIKLIEAELYDLRNKK